MGEIGRSHDEFMYTMNLWQLRCVVNGYFRRHRDLWSATRWQTYYLMAVSQADLKKAGIYKPLDLIKFPWEDDQEDTDLPDTEEIERLRREMDEWNAQQAQANE